ncbi:chemotaxis protein CheD [Pontivivens ytuae]|uniref:Probable chemoreceptor glutamine deamidase CheD n=1 Tax=Pontivivens ytuae TaxID=2789856 RepID=A0A7S9LP43_9RHOB|nr:chemotaxis protein CheD [Pontivivens ytuae]QPH52390.1 chemotaxis protein CheD [Pontivivens ytuae]
MSLVDPDQLSSGPLAVTDVGPGDVAVNGGADTVLTTLLGSCVSVCLLDRPRRIGGLNHFLLPRRHDPSDHSARYGDTAMARLMAEMTRAGAEESDLIAKIFGGADILKPPRSGSIGQANIAFARQILNEWNIPIHAEDTGGTRARRIFLVPRTGSVSVHLIRTTTDPHASVRGAAVRERPS